METPIFCMHREAEQVIENSGIPYTFLRCSPFMQSLFHFYDPAQANLAVPLGIALHSRQWGKPTFSIEHLTLISTEFRECQDDAGRRQGRGGRGGGSAVPLSVRRSRRRRGRLLSGGVRPAAL